MRIGVDRIVFRAEINSFGLSESEIREIANRVIEKEKRDGWDIDDVRPLRNGNYLVCIEYNNYSSNFDKDGFDFIKKHAKEIYERLEAALQDYKLVKRYVEIYNNCNGHNGNGKSEAKEIMRKVGIPVIS